MMITTTIVAEKISGYMNQLISKKELIDWCESQMQEASFENMKVQELIANLGIMNVSHFEISYEELQSMLSQLGYKLKVEVVH